MSTASLVIGNLTSPALYVGGFVAEVYTDSAYTQKIASMSCGATITYLQEFTESITQNVTGSDTPQSVSLTSLTIGGYTLVAGSIVEVGAGADTEIVTLDSVSTSSGINYITGIFLNNHVSGEGLEMLDGPEPSGIWQQTSVMVAQGLTPATTYYVAAGVQAPNNGAINWTYGTMTTAAAGTTYGGTYTQTSGGLLSWALTATSPPSDLIKYEAFFTSNSYHVPVASDTPSWIGTGTGLSFSEVNAYGVGYIITLFVRAVGTSGNYPWVLVDQRAITTAGGTGPVASTLGTPIDTLVPYTSGMTPSFPPPDTILNPSFESGNIGWTLGTNWGIGQGHPCFGNWSAYIAGTLTSPLTSSSSITNNYHLAATPGNSYYAQAMIDGSSAQGGLTDGSPSLTSYAAVSMAFYNASNALISTVYGNEILFGGLGWNLSRVQSVAPTGSSYAIVGCIVNNQETGTVFVDDFAANALPPGPVDVPDGPVYVKLSNVAPDHNIHISTALNPQGSVLPNQPIPLTYTYTGSSITVTCAPTSVLRADGSNFSIVGGSVTISGLVYDTTYYIYPYIRISDGTLQLAGSSTPATTPDPVQAMQAESDGCMGLGSISFNTVGGGDGVTGISGFGVITTTGSAPPSISISISGDGTGAGAGVVWLPTGTYPTFTWHPTLYLGAGSGYSTATATVVVTVASGGNPGYANGTTTYSCTLSPNSGSSGGTLTCPEENELVEVLGRGKVKVRDVKAGDKIKGHSFKTNSDLYRKVVLATSAVCSTWRVVNGYRCSPTEPVYYEGAWVLAFRVPGATLDTFKGRKVKLSVESDDYNEQNYYLVTQGDPLLIHNQLVSSC